MYLRKKAIRGAGDSNPEINSGEMMPLVTSRRFQFRGLVSMIVLVIGSIELRIERDVLAISLADQDLLACSSNQR